MLKTGIVIRNYHFIDLKPFRENLKYLYQFFKTLIKNDWIAILRPFFKTKVRRSIYLTKLKDYKLLKKGFLTSNGITIPITNEEVMRMKSRREKRKKDCEINEISKTVSTISN